MTDILRPLSENPLSQIPSVTLTEGFWLAVIFPVCRARMLRGLRKQSRTAEHLKGLAVAECDCKI